MELSMVYEFAHAQTELTRCDMRIGTEEGG